MLALDNEQIQSDEEDDLVIRAYDSSDSDNDNDDNNTNDEYSRTSNTQGIDPTKLSSKFLTGKIKAYTLDETEEAIQTIDDIPDVQVLHSLTNDLTTKPKEECVNKMDKIIEDTHKRHPDLKIIISLPTPRADDESLNIKAQMLSIMLKENSTIKTIDVGNQDRVVIQELIKTVAQVNQLETSTQKDFKVVILTEVDRLTKDAQHALRRTMEKYMATCRLILCCNSTSKVIPAIRSRCLGVRVPAPSIEEVCQVLQNICKKESLNLPTELARRIAEKGNRNLRCAILMCEACRVQQQNFTADQEVTEPDWELYLKETAQLIAQQQSPKRDYYKS
ncbi:RFC3_5 [Mytilus coruscus]|uniref:RFC3_5 n=1 Tax=Mytilus coruscus TaxID=42192 RepID=A0A6J8D6Z2_MYTCO|nr:RFC3_5 [Mytilus coruscus]